MHEDLGGDWEEIASHFERLARTAERFSAQFAVAARSVLGVGDVGVTVAFARGGPTESTGSSDRATVLEQVQWDVGEGPSVDALDAFIPIQVADLRDESAVDRWPVAARGLLDKGVRSVTAYPLRVGGAQIGVMSSYRESIGDLNSSDYANGLVVSTLLSTAILDSHASELSGSASEPWESSQSSSKLNFAAGIIAERHGMSIVDALIRIRGHAFVTGLSTRDVAQRIAEGTLDLGEGK